MIDELRIDIFIWDQLHWADKMFLRHYLSMKRYYDMKAMDKIKADSDAEKRKVDMMKKMPRQFVTKRGKVG